MFWWRLWLTGKKKKRKSSHPDPGPWTKSGLWDWPWPSCAALPASAAGRICPPFLWIPSSHLPAPGQTEGGVVAEWGGRGWKGWGGTGRYKTIYRRSANAQTQSSFFGKRLAKHSSPNLQRWERQASPTFVSHCWISFSKNPSGGDLCWSADAARGLWPLLRLFLV